MQFIKEYARWQAASYTNSIKRNLCRKLCKDGFFNADASLEIDRLTVEKERLTALVHELTATANKAAT